MVLFIFVGFYSRWGSIISIFFFGWGSIHIYMGWGCYQEWGFNPISHGRWSWRLPVYSNHQLSNKDRAAWQKTWWQYGFKYPTYFGRISFIFHYQIVGKFWIWKCSAKNFLIFHAFFINLWSRGKHSWLWILWSRVQISVIPFLFHRENCWCHQDSTTGL